MHIQPLVQGESELHYRGTSPHCICRQPMAREVAYIVDADLPLREALSELAGLIDLGTVHFESHQEFLDHSREDEASCLILDLCSRDHQNFDIQCQMAFEASPPVVFICSHGDVSSAVRALKAGAVGLLTAPINSMDLGEAVLTAFVRDRRQRQQWTEREELRQRHALLTPREREVLPLIVEGFMNKQAADVLGIAETTLQIHRSQVMKKMQAESVPRLVRMAATLEIPPWRVLDSEEASSANLQFLNALRHQWA